MHTSSHNICRYTHGTYCEDCKEFFPVGSDTYLRCDGIFSIWMVLHNLAIDHPKSTSIKSMRDEAASLVSVSLTETIEVLRLFEKKAKKLLDKWGLNEKSATIEMKRSNHDR